LFGDIPLVGRKRAPRGFWKADDTYWNDQRKVEKIIDRQFCFRTGTGGKVILTQPYDHIVVDEWQSWTAARGIELLMPPDPLASF
jgi:hypothetical protein